MPRFDVQQQQSVISADRARPESFGGGAGAAQLGRSMSDVAEKLNKKKAYDQEINVQKDISKLSIDMLQYNNSLLDKYPEGEGMYEDFQQEFTKRKNEIFKKYKIGAGNSADIGLLRLEESLSRKVIQSQAVTKSQHQIASYQEDRDFIINSISNDDIDGDYALELLNNRADALSGINPKVRSDIRQDNEDLVGKAEITNILSEYGVNAAYNALKDDAYKNLSPSLRRSLNSKIESKARHRVKESLRDASDMFAHGYPVGDLSADIAMAERFNLDEEKEELRKIKRTQNQVNEFVKNSLNQNIKDLTKMNSELMSGESKDLDKLNAMRSAFEVKSKALKEDPYSWLEQSGWWDGAIIDADMLGDMEDSLNQRRSIRESVLTREGVNIPLFKPQEISELAVALSKSNPEQKIGILNNIVFQLEDSEIPVVAMQIAPKSETITAAMVNAKYSPDVSRDILLGESRDIPIASEKEFLAEFMSQMGTSIQDESLRQNSMSAIKALYKEKAFQIGDNSGVIDNDLLEESIEQVLGPIAEISDTKVLSFRTRSGAYLSASDMEDLVEDLDKEVVRKTHGDVPRSADGSELDLEDLIDRGSVIATGDGLYIFKDQLGAHAQDENGEIFEIDLRKVYEYKIANPEPSLFRGRTR